MNDNEVREIIQNSSDAWWKSNSFAKLYPDIYITTILKQNLTSRYKYIGLDELKQLIPEILLSDKRILNDANLKQLFI